MEQGLDLSPLGLFLKASLVGKVVMAVLFLASLWTWVLIIEGSNFGPSACAGRSGRRAAGGEVSKSLASVAAAGDEEARRRIPGRDGRRIEVPRLGRHGAGRARTFDPLRGRACQISPSISSVAPFVGLFGTVWGIMSSFAAIGQAQDTSLATVAPGIAESLAATAYGLAAAIPASIGYNRIGAAYGRLGQEMASFVEERALTLLARPAEVAREDAPSRVRRRPDGAEPAEDWRGPLSAAGRHQRHAAGRRDAGSAHHLQVTAPMLADRHQGESAKRQDRSALENKEPVIVIVAKDGSVAVGKDSVTHDELAAKVKTKLGDSNVSSHCAAPRRFLTALQSRIDCSEGQSARR